MDPKKKAFLETAGFKAVRAADFFGLTEEQDKVVEIKIYLSALLRATRKARGLTQGQLAERLDCPQQNVGRMEKGHHSVSIDLLLRALLTAGATMDAITGAMQQAVAGIDAERNSVTEAPQF